LNGRARPGPQVVLVDGFDTIFGGCSEEKLLEAAILRWQPYPAW
jgi:hypothetical protein